MLDKVTLMGLLLSQGTSARYPAGPCGDDEDARVEGEITWDPVIMDDTSKFVFQNL